MIHAYAAHKPGGALKPFEYDPGSLGDDQVEINVESCGICHSDLSMLHNEWGLTQYPFVPGHEVIGTIAALGTAVTDLQLGQRVGLGWFAGSCLTCQWCMSGNHNLCLSAAGTIVGRYGGFADKVRAQGSWVLPLPEQLDPASAGPLFCGGITVFNPIVQFDVKPTDHVGVIGIGGLGHLALQFLRAWGCEVTAFSSNPAKAEEVKQLGATQVINSRDPEAIAAAANSFDLLLCTANADLDWESYINALRPKGRLHLVGVVPNPLTIPLFPLILGQKTISASPLGSPSTVADMLDFAARHHIAPITETFAFSQVNEALETLRSGSPRYRLVLQH
ncbi:MAG: NAD(P)-dependent alcohol dehydrogenase [Chloroflexaceae bacterium]|nr:NAD(P)-dependent alcohol dehydrogenase [Chloroflexaceae bacterium]